MGVDLMTCMRRVGRCSKKQASGRALFTPPKLVAVTTLTSLNEDDFHSLGIQRTLSEQALALSAMAVEAGIDGMVTSAHEAHVANAIPRRAISYTGIRMPSGDVGIKKG